MGNIAIGINIIIISTAAAATMFAPLARTAFAFVTKSGRGYLVTNSARAFVTKSGWENLVTKSARTVVTKSADRNFVTMSVGALVT